MDKIFVSLLVLLSSQIGFAMAGPSKCKRLAFRVAAQEMQTTVGEFEKSCAMRIILTETPAHWVSEHERVDGSEIFKFRFGPDFSQQMKIRFLKHFNSATQIQSCVLEAIEHSVVKPGSSAPGYSCYGRAH